MRIQNQRNFDRGETRFARSSAECCNPKRLQNGAKSFELSNISRKNTNFGAIKITVKKTPQEAALTGKARVESDNQGNFALLESPASFFIYEMAKKYNAMLHLGKTGSQNSWNIMSEQGSDIEKNMIKELGDYFKLHRSSLQIESIPNKTAEEAAINFSEYTKELEKK